MSTDDVLRYAPMAARIAERIDRMAVSKREIARRCGWTGKSETQLADVLRRLEAEKTVEVETLAKIARAIERPLTWLLTGEAPLAEVEGWTEAVAALRGKVSEAAIEAVGQSTWRAPPERIGPKYVRDLAQAWEDERERAAPSAR